MLIKKQTSDTIILPSEITPRDIFESRREFIRRVAIGSIAGASVIEMAQREAFAQSSGAQKLAATANPAYAINERKTAYKDVTSYNNFYEFGTYKGIARDAQRMPRRPWRLKVEGLVENPREFDIDDLIRMMPIEERVLRLRLRHAVARHDDDLRGVLHDEGRVIRRALLDRAAFLRATRRRSRLAAEAAENDREERAVHALAHDVGEDRTRGADQRTGDDQREVAEREADACRSPTR